MNTLFQLGILFRSLGSVEGRKKLQKIVHILQEFGVPFGVRYGYHHYGPFSDQLQDSLQSFSHDGLIKEEKVESQFPTSRFSPEPKLLQLLEQIEAEPNPAWVAFAKDLNGKSPRELEAISTLIYLEKMRSSGELKMPVEAAFGEYKPSLAEMLIPSQKRLANYRQSFQF